MAPRPALNRLTTRPSAGEWQNDELISLAEAAALLFPRGPLNAKSLRLACRRDELEHVVICGKTYTTLDALRRMTDGRKHSSSSTAAS